jgi:hypothetical protein
MLMRISSGGIGLNDVTIAALRAIIFGCGMPRYNRGRRTG